MNPMRPLIGVVGKHDEKKESIGQSRRYLEAVFGAGGLPVIIPATTDRALAREYAERIDGLLLPGSSTDIATQSCQNRRRHIMGRHTSTRASFAGIIAALTLLVAAPLHAEVL